jgi:hypothetical protein
MSQNLHRHFISKLHHAVDGNAQLAALRECSRLALNNPVLLKEYHEVLLLFCAYPGHKKVRELAIEELNRLGQGIKNHLYNNRWQHVLAGSGLPFTELRCQYSLEMVSWLLEKFPGQVKPAEAGATATAVRQTFQSLLPGIEFERSTHGDLNLWNRIKSLSGHYFNVPSLKWLLQLIQQQQWPVLLRDQLYDNLNIFISWSLTGNSCNRSFLHWPVNNVYCQSIKKKKVNSTLIIHQPVKPSLPLSEQEKKELIGTMRASLAFYYRETDPFTYADTTAIELFELGQGLQVALIGMRKERRLSLESYVGFMAFKNGVPVSYGGGWLFGHRCKIGVNIYPPFRGAESAWLFCQVMRLYYQRYNVHRFVVKPYQFGKGNPEGLKSGAFWFYYKLGFRPVNEKIRNAAEAGWKKITAGKSYRTSLKTLKSFTASNKEWIVEKKMGVHSLAGELSSQVSSMIRQEFQGDREQAIFTCTRKMKIFLGIRSMPQLSREEISVWQNWALLWSILPGHHTWNSRQRKYWLQLFWLKTRGSERDFILAWQQYKDLWCAEA